MPASFPVLCLISERREGLCVALAADGHVAWLLELLGTQGSHFRLGLCLKIGCWYMNAS